MAAGREQAIKGVHSWIEMYHEDEDRAADVDCYIEKIQYYIGMYTANGGDVSAPEWREAIIAAEPVLAVIERRREAARAAATRQTADMATQRQIDYLHSLGWRGETEGLTKANASKIIDARTMITAEDNDDFDEML